MLRQQAALPAAGTTLNLSTANLTAGVYVGPAHSWAGPFTFLTLFPRMKSFLLELKQVTKTMQFNFKRSAITFIAPRYQYCWRRECNLFFKRLTVAWS